MERKKIEFRSKIGAKKIADLFYFITIPNFNCLIEHYKIILYKHPTLVHYFIKQKYPIMRFS
jgi:hypothetical protein